MALHPLAGQPAPIEALPNIPKLMTAYYNVLPDPSSISQQVSFGTSGHRGCALNGSFNQHHIWAIAQAIVEYRQAKGITGFLHLGMDTHALSEAAYQSCLEVLIANGVTVVTQEQDGYTPTPVISHAILEANRENQNQLSDGIIITPSHNPPQDGGIKYNPPHGGPADSDITGVIQQRANQIMAEGLVEVKRTTLAEAKQSPLLNYVDYRQKYVAQLEQVIDMQAIAKAKIKIGVDPLGGSGIDYWEVIAETYGLDIEVVNKRVDPHFAFMPLDKDGKIRMDCSSACAMAGLIALKDKFDIAVANDPDYDRHGIVTRSGGLMNPNHYLAVAINYLCRHRTGWPAGGLIGKTLVSSSMIDKVADSLNRSLAEVPVGFKWFVEGLGNGQYLFAGEESAGASFLRKDGSVWSTDKDGIILALLAAEILAVTGKDPSQHYQQLTESFSTPVYQRVDAPATREQKAKLAKLDKGAISAEQLAGDDIVQVFTHAPGNRAALGGVKVSTEFGWFAARPSGTEEIYKIYAESFKGEQHLQQILQQAQGIVDKAIS